MKNIERLTNHISKHGAKNLMIHTIFGTSNWVIAQRMEADKWELTIGSPLGTDTYQLGTVTNDEIATLWLQIDQMSIDDGTIKALQTEG